MSRLELRTGARAYFETVRDGLVPCLVLAVGPLTASLRVTRTYAGYQRGEIIDTGHHHAIPRGAIWRRRYKTLILPYSVIRD